MALKMSLDWQLCPASVPPACLLTSLLSWALTQALLPLTVSSLMPTAAQPPAALALCCILAADSSAAIVTMPKSCRALVLLTKGSDNDVHPRPSLTAGDPAETMIKLKWESGSGSGKSLQT